MKHNEILMKPNATIQAIEALDAKYPNAIQIFGGAISVETIDDIVDMLPYVIRNAISRKWHAGPVDACRKFCHLCFVDPALVEACIRMKFEDLVG